jgi:hypothetical protein
MDMGANLVPRVSGFSNIRKTVFNEGDDSVGFGCISAGEHRVIYFDLFLDNKGDADFHVGKPIERPDVFLYQPTRFKEKFYTWRLTDNAGVEKKTGFKVAVCLMDFTPPRRYNCGDQGVSVGSHDLYAQDMHCQFIEVDNLPDGTYTLHVTANAYTVQQVKNGQTPLRGLEEDNYEDNTISVQLELKGENVSVTNDSGPTTDQLTRVKAEFERGT